MKALDSVPEFKLLKALRGLNLSPDTQVKIHRTSVWKTLHGGAHAYFKLDLALLNVKLAIEIDGQEFHSSQFQRERDAARQREIEHQGWRLIRFTAREVERSPNLCAKIVQMFVPASVSVQVAESVATG